MGLLNVIRRLALREELPIREIARRTGLSRNVVRKYRKSGAVEPTFATPERPSKLDPFAEKLAGWLRTKAGTGRKQRKVNARFMAMPKRVSPTCLITFERNRDSVPCSGLTRPHWGHGPLAPFANRPVSLHI